MIQITDKTKCCGCTACANACPAGAIVMMPDAEGFLYPQIQQDICINCGMCEAICPVCSERTVDQDVKGYIVRYRDSEVLKNSTSGGAFTAFAAEILSRGGVVYGTGYDENMRVICKKATTIEQLAQMRGSKFVQSDLGETFLHIKSELAQGITVLFTGTPCQVEGLLSYLRKKPENLLCIDFVCRGVPSPKLWENYVQMMEKKYRSKMIGARFKHKTYGYHATTMKVDFANGKTYYGSGRVDPMMKAFVEEMASRPSCGACAFKTVSRRSDITMFDCYEFSKLTGLPDDNKGYSSLMIHSAYGMKLLEDASGCLEIHNMSVDQLVKRNGIMVMRSAKFSEKRDELYKLICEESIDKAMYKLSRITCTDYLVELVKKYIYNAGLIIYIKRFREKYAKKG